MIQDNHRPSYHHLPEEGLLWDPCAAVFRNGRYHLFYLHDSWAAAGPSKRSDGYNWGGPGGLDSSRGRLRCIPLVVIPPLPLQIRWR